MNKFGLLQGRPVVLSLSAMAVLATAFLFGAGPVHASMIYATGPATGELNLLDSAAGGQDDGGAKPEAKPEGKSNNETSVADPGVGDFSLVELTGGTQNGSAKRNTKAKGADGSAPSFGGSGDIASIPSSPSSAVIDMTWDNASEDTFTAVDFASGPASIPTLGTIINEGAPGTALVSSPLIGAADLGLADDFTPLARAQEIPEHSGAGPDANLNGADYTVGVVSSGPAYGVSGGMASNLSSAGMSGFAASSTSTGSFGAIGGGGSTGGTTGGTHALSPVGVTTNGAPNLPVGQSTIGNVNLGLAGNFTLLALTGGVSDGGGVGPDANPNSVDGPIGVVSSGQSFKNTGGNRVYNGPILLNTGATYSNSSSFAPPPQSSAAINTMLAQAKADALAASSFAAGLTPDQTFGVINTNLSITETTVGNYVFNITSINLGGNETLTLRAPVGSTYVLNISTTMVFNGGKIIEAGGLTNADVLLNYTGTTAVSTSGGGNATRIFGTLLAPNAQVRLTPGYLQGAIIAADIVMSGAANVAPVPEVTSGWVIFAFAVLLAGSCRSRRRVPAKHVN